MKVEINIKEKLSKNQLTKLLGVIKNTLEEVAPCFKANDFFDLKLITYEKVNDYEVKEVIKSI